MEKTKINKTIHLKKKIYINTINKHRQQKPTQTKSKQKHNHNMFKQTTAKKTSSRHLILYKFRTHPNHLKLSLYCSGKIAETRCSEKPVSQQPEKPEHWIPPGWATAGHKSLRVSTQAISSDGFEKENKCDVSQ